MANGGIIGKTNTPTYFNASGVWNLKEQYHSETNKIWPRMIGQGSWSSNLISTVGTTAGFGVSLCNVWYRRSIMWFYYTSTELKNTFGFTGGAIVGLRFYVVGAPGNQPLPNYAIGVKNGIFTGYPGKDGYTIIKSASSENFTSSTFKEFTTTPFIWAGNDLAFAVAWGYVTSGYSQSGTHAYGSGTMWMNQSDSGGTYTINVDDQNNNTAYRPVIQLKVS